MKNILYRTFFIQEKARITLILRLMSLFALFLISSFNASADTSQEKTVSFHLKNVPLSVVFSQIEKQTDYLFVFDEQVVDIKRIVSVDATDSKVGEVLNKVLNGTDIVFTMEGKNIALKEKSNADKNSSGQTYQKILGVVTDQKGEPLVGAIVTLKGTKVQKITDSKGNFSLDMPGQSTLIVSYIGYSTLEYQVGSQKNVLIRLEEDARMMEEVVVVGYGTQKRSDNTGAISTVNSEKFNKGFVSSPEQLLNGKTAGVQIITANGEPGSAPSIRIRGTNSITASSEPLFVIDGVPVDNNRTQLNLNSSSDNGLNNSATNPLVMLASEDIESMTILKDASATAIYGSRGANGVIMITTKRGAVGEVKLSYDGSFGFSSLPKKLDILSASDYKKVITAKGLSATFGNADTDWQDEIFRTAYSQSHNVAFSGGNQNSQYRVSLGVQDQDGIIINTDMNRYNVRVNVNQKCFNDRLKFQFNMANSNYNSNNLVEQQTGGYRGGVLNNILKMDPTQPVKNADGTYLEYSNDVRNPVALQNQMIDKTEGNRVIGNLETELTIFSDLKAKLNLAYDRDAQERNIYQPIASSIGKDVSGRAINSDRKNGSKLLELYLTYDKQFKNHQINILGGYSWQQYDNYFTSTLAEGFSNDNLSYNSMDATGKTTIDILNESNRLISYFGRVNYTYDNRYILTATLRTDGSSRFGKDNQYGLFPSVGLAWRVINEKWMENINALSNLKVRIGYGGTGNQEIGNYRYVSTLSVNQLGGSYFGNTYYARYTATTIPNSKLQWEQTTQMNVGIDFGFFKQRIYGTVDLYNKNTTKLLVELVAVQPAVSSAYLDNIGEMTNKGIEFSIGAIAIQKKDLQWTIDFNIASNKNNITKLYEGSDIHTGTISGSGAPSVGIQIIREGEAYGSFYGYEYKGLDANGKEIFTDFTGDGITSADKTIIGHALPTATMGLSSTLKYKDFDLNIGFRGCVGNKIYNNTRAEISQTNRLAGQNVSTEGSQGIAHAAYEYASSRWLEDGSFLRLDNLTLGYNLKDIFGTKNKVRIYCTGQNLFVITKYSGYDPEVNTKAGNSSASSIGIDYDNYPKSRGFSAGININF